jgi:hypothetical protein
MKNEEMAQWLCESENNENICNEKNEKLKVINGNRIMKYQE